MKNELIKVIETKKGNQAVDARDLHEFLEVGTRYNDWIKRHINNYNFDEGIDYVCRNYDNDGCLLKNEYLVLSAIQKVEYILTIDTAKEIAMVSKTERGSQARKYFIKVEKDFRAQQHKPKQLSPNELILSLAQTNVEQEKKMIELESKVNQQEQIVNRVIENQEKAIKVIEALPQLEVTEDVPDITTRKVISKYISAVSLTKNIDHQRIWRHIYKMFDATYNINVYIRATNRSMTKLDYIEQSGRIDKLYALLMKLYPMKNNIIE